MEIKVKENLRDIVFITVGAFIYSFGLNYFYIANKFADGGLSGVSALLHYTLDYDMGITYFVLNIPLMILGYKLVGKKFFIKTFYGTVMTAMGMRIFATYGYVLDDKIMASIFGGVVTGIGLGIIFAGGGSSGGSDIIVKMMNKYLHIPVGKGFLLIDSVVLAALCIFLGKEVFMYTIIGMFISTSTIDHVQNGFYKAKAVIIISEKCEELSIAILEEIGRGVTVFEGKGAYTNTTKNVIYCIMTRSELSQIRKIVKRIDKNSFLTISDVSEVLGEGFVPLA